MGGKGGKRKGGGLVVPSFGAGGMRTPSPTPSASGSVAGAVGVELAGGISYDVRLRFREWGWLRVWLMWLRFRRGWGA